VTDQVTESTMVLSIVMRGAETKELSVQR